MNIPIIMLMILLVGTSEAQESSGWPEWKQWPEWPPSDWPAWPAWPPYRSSTDSPTQVPPISPDAPTLPRSPVSSANVDDTRTASGEPSPAQASQGQASPSGQPQPSQPSPKTTQASPPQDMSTPSPTQPSPSAQLPSPVTSSIESPSIPTLTPSPSPSPREIPSPTLAQLPQVAPSPTPMPSPIPQVTPSPTPMPSPTPQLTPSPTPMPSSTPQVAPSPRQIPSPTPVPSPRVTPTTTPSPSVDSNGDVILLPRPSVPRNATGILPQDRPEEEGLGQITRLLRPETPDSGFANVIEAADARESLSTFVTALTVVSLRALLDDNDYMGTIFAPTNRAFENALGQLGMTLEELLADTDTLRNILRYHVLPVATFENDLQNGVVLNTLLEGQTLSVRINNRDRIVIIGVGSTAVVGTADIIAGEGVIHVVNRVLLPFEGSEQQDSSEETSENGVIGQPQFETFEEGVRAGELSSFLTAAETAGLLPVLSDSSFEGTIFVPTNNAFESALTQLGVSDLASFLNNVGLLQDILNYHIVPTVFMEENIAEQGELTTVLGTVLRVTENGVFTVISDQSTAQVLDSASAGKGIMYVIDMVLIPNLTS